REPSVRCLTCEEQAESLGVEVAVRLEVDGEVGGVEGQAGGRGPLPAERRQEPRRGAVPDHQPVPPVAQLEDPELQEDPSRPPGPQGPGAVGVRAVVVREVGRVDHPSRPGQVP
ncbi:hypothetical protein chiPu_0030675, partial [Chiloscyllium punctatum]|nr:hypothetical protein [Chiloscyllium punctatum]